VLPSHDHYDYQHHRPPLSIDIGDGLAALVVTGPIISAASIANSLLPYTG